MICKFRKHFFINLITSNLLWQLNPHTITFLFNTSFHNCIFEVNIRQVATHISVYFLFYTSMNPKIIAQQINPVYKTLFSMCLIYRIYFIFHFYHATIFTHLQRVYYYHNSHHYLYKKNYRNSYIELRMLCLMSKLFHSK